MVQVPAAVPNHRSPCCRCTARFFARDFDFYVPTPFPSCWELSRFCHSAWCPRTKNSGKIGLQYRSFCDIRAHCDEANRDGSHPDWRAELRQTYANITTHLHLAPTGCTDALRATGKG